MENHNGESTLSGCRESRRGRKCMQNAVKAKAVSWMLVDEPDKERRDDEQLEIDGQVIGVGGALDKEKKKV
jgi:hypothetical protein